MHECCHTTLILSIHIPKTLTPARDLHPCRAELRRQEGVAHGRAPAAELELLLECLPQAPAMRAEAAGAVARALAQGVLVKEQVCACYGACRKCMERMLLLSGATLT